VSLRGRLAAVTYGRHLVVVGALLGVVAACGGDDAELPTPADPTTTTQSPSTAPPTFAGGVDASADLSRFACAPDATGAWNASGVLTSSAAGPADYSVTVIVSGPQEPAAPGRRRIFADLVPAQPVRFRIRQVPPQGAGDLSCQVRVLRLTTS
jgi:hypothetical protein